MHAENERSKSFIFCSLFSTLKILFVFPFSVRVVSRRRNPPRVGKWANRTRECARRVGWVDA